MFFNFFLPTSLSFADSGWAAAIFGGIKGYADSKSESLQRQLEYEYQRKLILYQQQMEYERQERLRHQIIKEQQAAQRRKETEANAELEENERQAKVREIAFMTSLIDLAESNQNEAQSNLTKAIPNWKSLAGSDRFGQWFINQPIDVMALAESSNPDDAIKLIKLFKKNRNKE